MIPVFVEEEARQVREFDYPSKTLESKNPVSDFQGNDEDDDE